MRIYSAYDQPPKVVLDCIGAGEAGVSLTRQSMKAETDINNILARYARSGLLTHVAQNSPVYADVSESGNYREAVEHVREAEKFFAGLPAKVRAHFENDAGAFLDFMTDPTKEAEARELGLVKPDPVVEPPIDEVPGPGIQARGADGRFESPR